jgi:hypothetical protein
MLDQPWKVLPTPPQGELSALRVDALSRHAFFWAKKSDGRVALVLKLSSPVPPVAVVPQVRGIDITWAEGNSQLQLALLAPADLEMFKLLCDDLIRTSAPCPDGPSCVEALLSRLFKWQRLLSRGGAKMLTDREIRGLLAELMLLRDEIIPRYGHAAINCWRGPEGHPHDFTIDEISVEVKAHLSGSPPEIEISSIEQLWADHGGLFLCVQHLSDSPASGECLPDLVTEIASTLTKLGGDTQAFEDKLAMVGYIDLQAYRQHRYLKADSVSYGVSDGFPRVAPSAVTPGVVRVRYAIGLDACVPFKTTIEWPQSDGKHD